jgi:hypothetical protein
MRKKIKKSSISEELINEMKSEAIFNKWVEEYFGKQYSNDLLNEAEPPKAGGEESEAQRLGLVHKGRGYYAKDKTSPATHKSEDGKIRPLTPDEIEAEKAKETGAQPAGKPGEKEKEKGEPEAEKKPEKSPEEKEKEKSQTLSGKADLATDAEKRKEKDAEPGTEDSAETPAISPSQAKANEDTPSENLTDEEATAQLAHEKHDLSHDEQQAYEFLDGVPDEEKAAAIDEALNNRSWWQKFSQDTMVGGFLAKKGQQFADTGRGIRSAAKSIASGRGPSLGITKDCSGAPPGPHAPGQGARAPKKSEPPVNMTGGLTELHEVSITLFELEKIAEAIERTNHLKKMGLEEDAASRQKYLKSLGKDGKPKQDEPKDDSKCKDVHYTDYQKRDENGKRMVEKKPVYKKGKKPDLGAGTDDDNLTALKGKAIGFTRSDIDPESGYFKKDDKYYDAEGSEVDKEGNALDKDGKPQQKKNWLGRPVTEEVPVWDDNLTPEQKHAAEHSHHQSHEEGHALKHTAIEATVIAASVMAGPTLAAWGGAKVAASSGASHGVLEVAAHVAAHTAKDVAKHSVLDIMGASNALGAGAIGAGLTVATAGILESLISLNESNDPNKNKEFMTKLVRLTLERMKTYKMTPQQKLQSLRDYKKKNKLKKIKQNTEKRNDLLNTLNETALTYSKAKTIKDFVDFATRRLNLKETPKIKLLNNTKMAEQASTLGGFNPSTKEIVVQTKNRLGADILRTLAHEMVHLKQDELGLIRNPEKDGETGSPIENKANSIAGILLREYGRNNKTIYLESINSFKKKVDEVETIENEDINIPVDKGDDVLVGKFKNKRITIKNIGKDDHGMPTINGRPAATFRIAKEKIEESSTLTASTGLTDDNDGQWLQRGRKRVLNAGDGANKKDPWFQNGGWIQTDFPEADNIFASDEEMMSYKTASYDVDRVLRQPKKLQTDFEKDKHKDKIEIKETSDPYDAYSKKILDMLKQ